MSGAAPASPPKVRATSWPELDVLRGLAVIAMIANHAVASWHSRDFGFTDLAHTFFFIGGFAPVLFFFATGFGSGLQSLRPRGSGQHRYGFGRKLVILVLADHFMLWRWGVVDPVLGLDFLGFIALSTAVVEPLRRARHGTALALAGAALVLFVRFVLSPWIQSDAFGATDLRWFGLWTGRAAVDGVAFPPLPWLVYPLLGFALGRTVGGKRAELERRPDALFGVLAATAIAGVALTRWLASAGLEATRYGIHSLGYLPLAIAALAISAALAWGLCRASARRGGVFGSLERAISMRGVASLAVVPLHLGVVYAIGMWARPGLSEPAFAAVVAVTIVVCMWAGRAFGRAAESIERSGYGPLAWWVGGAVAALMAGVLWWPVLGSLERHSAAHFAQLCLCGLLVWSPTSGKRTDA